MANPVRDPHSYIRPEAYRVADHLLGTPLATPARRLGAILVDLVLVAILILLLNALALFVALVSAWFVFRLSRSDSGRWYMRFGKRSVGCFGAIIVFGLAYAAVDSIRDMIGDDEEEQDGIEASFETDSGSVTLEGVGIVTGFRTMRDVAALADAERAGERDSIADAMVARLLADGVTTTQMSALLDEARRDEDLPAGALVALEAAVEATAARLEGRQPRSPEELRRARTPVQVAGSETAAADTVTVAQDTTRVDSTLVAAYDSLASLRARLDETSDELAEERAQREAVQRRLEQGTFGWVMSSIADEFGLGLGWLGLYFTACLVIGRGQTVGKRLFRLRVIRLDGRPIGWWAALQRFGGYSASVFTGMLGFAEMFWDENRQALQDKLVFTVVIQEPRKGQADEARPGLATGSARIHAPSTPPRWDELTTAHAVSALSSTRATPIPGTGRAPGGEARALEPAAAADAETVSPADAGGDARADAGGGAPPEAGRPANHPASDEPGLG